MSNSIPKYKYSDRLIFSILVLTAICCACLLCDNAVARTKDPVLPRAPIDSPDVAGQEREGDIQTYAPVERTRGLLVERLHRERRAGHSATCRKLEAQLKKPQPEGEAAGGTILIPSSTFSGAGDLKQQQSSEPTLIENTPPAGVIFGNDVQVRSANFPTMEYRHDMVSDSNGNLYIAWVDSTSTYYYYLQVYKSTDGGQTWTPFGYIANNDHHLQNPSLAVGEGFNGDRLLIAYTVDEWYDMNYPEVATSPLTSSNFTIHSVPVYPSWEEYRYPVIVTDSYKYDTWFAYLTCEGVFESAFDNINVCSWRSMDGGTTWGDEEVPFGNLDDMYWSTPDMTFGTTLDRLLIVTFNHDLSSLHTIASDTFGSTWNNMILFHNLDVTSLTYNVDPQIAAATEHDNVMICCTKYSTAHHSADIGQGYSQDAGQTWSTLWDMQGSSDYNEHSPVLTANEGGGHWHLAWTSAQELSVLYSKRPQDLSELWQVMPFAISDTCTASSEPTFSKKGIASNWDTDVACVCWSDFRDGVGDYDCFVDFGDHPGMMTNCTAFDADEGGTVNFFLNAGVENAGRSYVIVGSATGTSPGTPLPGGHVVLPLNWDIFSDFVLTYANTPMFPQFIGTLDLYGVSLALLVCPPIPGYGGLDLYFAYALRGPYDYVSNPVKIRVRS